MKKIFTIIIGLFMMVGCSANPTERYHTISLEDGYKLIQEEKVKVLDVRTAEEFESGHIPNAINIPVQDLEERLTELTKEESYFVICRSGNRSKTASEILVKNNFTKIYNGRDGIVSWQYEIE